MKSTQLRPEFLELAEAHTLMALWEGSGARTPMAVKERYCKAEKVVLELQDQLTEDLPANGIGRI